MNRPPRVVIVLALAVWWSDLSGAAETSDGNEIPWSFAPLVRPEIDPKSYPNWALDDLDRFIAERLETEGLRPNPSADRRTLIRRAAFDLTGLPPTIGEIEAFLNDPGSDQQAFTKVVDSYLASERFGERWGRHWLDVARYADSVGRTWNAPFVYAWRYRDWVIDALNADKPYNRFIAEQIAGDLLPAETVEQRRSQVIATGFLSLGSLAINMGGSDAFVLDQIDDQIDVTTRGFLGLSVACARCHDHKYDPVAQMDYYALAGVFYSSWTYSGTPHISDHAGSGYVDPEMLVSLPTDLGTPVDRVRSVPAGIHSMSDLRQYGGKAPPPYRTVYLPVLRDLLPDEFGVFDFPDPSSVAGLRHITTAPPQALFFMNSEFVEDLAYRTVDRLAEMTKPGADDAQRISLAYQLLLGREPSAEEIDDAEDLMRDLDTADLKDAKAYRWMVFVQALMAGAEFRYVL